MVELQRKLSIEFCAIRVRESQRSSLLLDSNAEGEGLGCIEQVAKILDCASQGFGLVLAEYLQEGN
jgi:hypothetical protein